MKSFKKCVVIAEINGKFQRRKQKQNIETAGLLGKLKY